MQQRAIKMNKLSFSVNSVLLYMQAKPKTHIKVQDELKKEEVRILNF